MGRPAPEYVVAIVRDDGSPVEPGETGNLLVAGVPGISLFAGYLDDDVATADAYDERCWLRTGDLVTPEEDGFVVFADRAKDVLKVGGENVAASEIERVIAAVPGVLEVAVVGGPDPMLDEVAFVRSPGGRRRPGSRRAGRVRHLPRVVQGAARRPDRRRPPAIDAE